MQLPQSAQLRQVRRQQRHGRPSAGHGRFGQIEVRQHAQRGDAFAQCGDSGLLHLGCSQVQALQLRQLWQQPHDADAGEVVDCDAGQGELAEGREAHERAAEEVVFRKHSAAFGEDDRLQLGVRREEPPVLRTLRREGALQFIVHGPCAGLRDTQLPCRAGCQVQ